MKILEPSQISVASIAIAGTTDRDWFYMLRDLDPGHARYNVVVIPLDDYVDLDNKEHLAERLEDLNYVIGSLRLADLLTFPGSYPSWPERWQVFQGSLFKGLTYRRDLREFLRAPKKRLASVDLCRRVGWDSIYNYPGNDHSLGGLTYDPESQKLTFPPGISLAVQKMVRARLDFSAISVRGKQRAYLKRWLGAIESLYQGKDVRFVLYRMSQYPVHIPLPEPSIPDPESTVNTLRRDSRNIILDEHLFDFLERPDCYFDGLHLNATGRDIFSQRLAQEMKRILAGFPGGAAPK